MKQRMSRPETAVFVCGCGCTCVADGVAVGTLCLCSVKYKNCWFTPKLTSQTQPHIHIQCTFTRWGALLIDTEIKLSYLFRVEGWWCRPGGTSYLGQSSWSRFVSSAWSDSHTSNVTCEKTLTLSFYHPDHSNPEWRTKEVKLWKKYKKFSI